MNNPSTIQAMIEGLLEQIRETNKSLPDATILSVLTDKARLEYLDALAYAKDARQQKTKPSGKVPGEFRQYRAALKVADLLDTRAEATPHDKWPAPLHPLKRPLEYGGLRTCQLLRRQAEEEYEHALELLEELLGNYPWLVAWLDRPVSFDHHDCNVSPDSEGVPRLITSRSSRARHYFDRPKSKRTLQTLALQSSLTALKHGTYDD